jgi:glycolate oxidase iron-sulfur subunit
MRSVAEGELEITPGFVEEMYFCLDCQACETACPAGVKYGSLVEASRAQIEQQRLLSWPQRFWKGLILNWGFLSLGRLKLFARLLRAFQRSGLDAVLKRSGLLRLLSWRMSRLQEMAPRISATFSDESLPEILSPPGERKYRVGFLTGCLMNVLYADVNHDTVKVLLRNGCEVVVPHGQSCCGSLHAHNGLMETARRLARQTVETFEPYRLDAIVMNSAGCGAFMKEYGHLLVEDGEYAVGAQRVARKVKDLSEFLLSIDFVRPQAELNRRVAYHEACHLVHTQKVSQQPREILKMIPGVQLSELNEATWCCGSAGIYNILRYEDSMKLLERKVKNLRDTNADTVVLGNPGCQAQIDLGVRRNHLNIEVLHLATFLRRAYES